MLFAKELRNLPVLGPQMNGFKSVLLPIQEAKRPRKIVESKHECNYLLVTAGEESLSVKEQRNCRGQLGPDEWLLQKSTPMQQGALAKEQRNCRQRDRDEWLLPPIPSMSLKTNTTTTGWVRGKK